MLFKLAGMQGTPHYMQIPSDRLRLSYVGTLLWSAFGQLLQFKSDGNGPASCCSSNHLTCQPGREGKVAPPSHPSTKSVFHQQFLYCNGWAYTAEL